MPLLDIPAAAQCAYDAVALGEVMLRLDPGDMRIHTAREFRAWEGGGEYNVGRNLRRVFDRRTAVLTSLVDNPIGRLIEDLILNGGVDTRYIRWVDDDGIGRAARNGLNFTERGFGLRGGLGCSDRGYTAISQMRADELDVDELFDGAGVRWLHTGGIYAALSPMSGATVLTLVREAKKRGVIVSFDCNYRPSLWKAHPDPAALQEINRQIAQHVDVMIASPYDYRHSFGLDIDVPPPTVAPEKALESIVELTQSVFPSITVLAHTTRTVHTANSNDWGAVAWSEDTGVITATPRSDVPILDRVGGGDGFAAGLIDGLMDGRPLAQALERGTASGALAMSTPGDYSMARRRDVDQLQQFHSAATNR